MCKRTSEIGIVTARVLGFAINKLVFHEHLLRVYFRLTLSNALVISRRTTADVFVWSIVVIISIILFKN